MSLRFCPLIFRGDGTNVPSFLNPWQNTGMVSFLKQFKLFDGFYKSTWHLTPVINLPKYRESPKAHSSEINRSSECSSYLGLFVVFPIGTDYMSFTEQTVLISIIVSVIHRKVLKMWKSLFERSMKKNLLTRYKCMFSELNGYFIQTHVFLCCYSLQKEHSSKFKQAKLCPSAEHSIINEVNCVLIIKNCSWFQMSTVLAASMQRQDYFCVKIPDYWIFVWCNVLLKCVYLAEWKDDFAGQDVFSLLILSKLFYYNKKLVKNILYILYCATCNTM